MKRCYTLLSLLCLFSFGLSAQTKKIKWGDIPMEYLQMKTYDKDTSAGAVILLDHGVYNLHPSVYSQRGHGSNQWTSSNYR
ncbi:MAG: hypothetical protein IPG01_14770 [Chitinophagaceae bacterium]|nr:hypothetical protein [Chitinophagaceae bacterium]